MPANNPKIKADIAPIKNQGKAELKPKREGFEVRAKVKKNIKIIPDTPPVITKLTRFKIFNFLYI